MLSLGLAVVGVVSLCVWQWEGWAQRRCIAALHARDPEVRGAALRELHARLPRLREEVLPGLIAALEKGWDTPLPPEDVLSLVAGWAHGRRDRVLRFYPCRDFIDVPPDFWAPPGSSWAEQPRQHPPGHWGLMGFDALIGELLDPTEQEDTLSILQGKLSMRAPLGRHLQLLLRLSSLRRQAHLFHQIFPRTEAGRQALPALARIARLEKSPGWLRTACLHASEQMPAATHMVDTNRGDRS